MNLPSLAKEQQEDRSECSNINGRTGKRKEEETEDDTEEDHTALAGGCLGESFH